MKFLCFYLILVSAVIVQSHEFKGFTLKFLYQVFTGEFLNLKKKVNLEKNILRNETSSYLGKSSVLLRLVNKTFEVLLNYSYSTSHAVSNPEAPLLISLHSDYLKYSDIKRCSIYDVNEAEKRDKRAKCIKANGNGTMYLMNGLNDVMQLLAPSGSENPGNCAIILFYTKFCPTCHSLVPHWNSLARNFLDIKVSRG